MRLLICIGIRSADAAVSRGAACIALLHPRGWKNSGQDWDRIPLAKREIGLVLGSLAGSSPALLDTASELEKFLTDRGANVRILALPSGPGQMRNLDEYLAAGHSPDEIWSLPAVEIHVNPVPAISQEPPRYRRTDQGLCLEEVDEESNVILRPLTNFDASITAELEVTDGAETHTEFELEATIAGERRALVLQSEEFAKMEWVIPALGPKAVIYPPGSNQDHARAALQLLSEKIERKTIYTHLGWILHDDLWFYAHARGAIGARWAVTWDEHDHRQKTPKCHAIQEFALDGPAGPVNDSSCLNSMCVRAPEPLKRFWLPVPPSLPRQRVAVRRSLGLADLAPDKISLLLLCATYRAPLGGVNYSVSLDGITGRGKTTLAALYQQHFGPELDFENPPIGWGSTANFLEALAFQAKDTLLVIDDWVARGSQADVDRANRDADRFLRAQANKTGRGRCTSTGVPRPVRAPRCLPVCTQEESPNGQSLNARVFRLQVLDFDLFAPNKLRDLSRYQFRARRGILARAMAGYIAYLAADLEGNRLWHSQTRQELLTAFRADGRHPRTAYVAADLAAAFNLFLAYAYELGAITKEEEHAYWKRLDIALSEQVDNQQRHLKSQDPVEQFLSCLHAALSGHQCHVAANDGGSPPSRQGCWGWREETIHQKKSIVPTEDQPVPSSTQSSASDDEEQFDEYTRWRPCGQRVGWVFVGRVYLLAEKALGEVQRIAAAMGHRIPLQWESLGKQLSERKLLAERDLSRGRYTKRFNAEGARHNTLCLDEETLMQKEFHGSQFNDPDYDGPPLEELLNQGMKADDFLVA
jgi:hypothetical protein